MFEVEDDVRLERMSDLGYVFEVSEDEPLKIRMKYRVDDRGDRWSLPVPRLSHGWADYPLNIEYEIEHWSLDTYYWFYEFTVSWEISFKWNDYWILPDYGVIETTLDFKDPNGDVWPIDININWPDRRMLIDSPKIGKLEPCTQEESVEI